jgi:hypothetical protein
MAELKVGTILGLNEKLVNIPDRRQQFHMYNYRTGDRRKMGL